MLFTTPLAAPLGGIGWSKRPYGTAWAQYFWGTGPDGAEVPPRVEMNVPLDARTVAPEILEFLVYHELLHHEDIELARKPNPDTSAPQSPHDREFREREQKHGATIKANAWLDTFQDHIAAIDDEGRLVL